ncbi:MAG: DUF4019 domain-containing protein, partial [Waddliaceae bacterium]
MKITKLCDTFFVCLFFLAITSIVQAETDPLQASAQASEKWLLLVDNGKYGESWDVGSATFKLTIPKDRWVSLMGQIRKPLG